MSYFKKMNNIAFIIGNGKSREHIKLDSLIGKGTTFGCNALYRDYKPPYDIPDYLVAMDPLMCDEIDHSDFPQDRFIVPPYHEQFEPKECNPNQPRNNAGMVAMNEAIKKGFTTLYMFGFDFIIDDQGFSIDNIYEGSPCYGLETRASYSDNINRVKFMEWFAIKNNNIKFKFVVPKSHRTIHRINSSNVTGMFYDDFCPLMGVQDNIG